MELSKHKNHRNYKYLNWMRTQDCVISGRKAHVAHHVNLGTNGGKGIKASDYFCIPLLNEFHTSGLWAVHAIGEATFFETFKLDRNQLFVYYLEKFLHTVLGIKKEFPDGESDLLKIQKLIDAVEEKACVASREKAQKIPKVRNPIEKMLIKKIKLSETEYYQKSKQLKKEIDKELREKHKEIQSQFRKEQYRKAKEFQKSLRE